MLPSTRPVGRSRSCARYGERRAPRSRPARVGGASLDTGAPRAHHRDRRRPGGGGAASPRSLGGRGGAHPASRDVGPATCRDGAGTPVTARRPTAAPRRAASSRSTVSLMRWSTSRRSAHAPRSAVPSTRTRTVSRPRSRCGRVTPWVPPARSRRWLRAEARRLLTERVASLAPGMAVAPTTMTHPGPALAVGERLTRRLAVLQLAAGARTTVRARCGRDPRARPPAPRRSQASGSGPSSRHTPRAATRRADGCARTGTPCARRSTEPGSAARSPPMGLPMPRRISRRARAADP